MDHLSLPTAIVGGYSFGAGVAVAAALRYPDRVAGLVLAGPAYAGSEIGPTPPQRSVWANGQAFFERARSEGLAKTLLATATSKAERAELSRRLGRQDQVSFLAAHAGELATAQPFDSLATLDTIRVPALLLSDDSDDAHDPQVARWYAEHLPAATTVSVVGFDPTTWAGPIRSLLQQVGGSN